MDMVISFSWPTGDTPRLSKGKKVIECIMEKLRHHGCSYQREGSTVH